MDIENQLKEVFRLCLQDMQVELTDELDRNFEHKTFLPSPYSSHDQSLARRFLTFLLPSSSKAWPVQLKTRNVSAQLRIVSFKSWVEIRKGTKPIAPRQLHRKDELKADLLHKSLPQGPEESIRCEAVCQVR